jgi:hypothetical protein
MNILRGRKLQDITRDKMAATAGIIGEYGEIDGRELKYNISTYTLKFLILI